VELHILNETGMVVLLDDEMRIIKPVYDYLKFQRQRDRALNTIKANGRDLKIYWDFLKNEGYEFDEVTPNLIAEFVEYLRLTTDEEIALYKESKRSNITINRILSTLHMFYQFEADMQEIDNPMLSHNVSRSSNTFKGILEHARTDNRTKQSIFKVGIFANKQVNFGVIFEILVIFVLVYLPPFQSVFHTTGLGLNDWLLLCIWPPLVLLVEEVRKAWLRRNDMKKS